MVKGEDRFIFNYELGQEQELSDHFLDMASNRENSFDWYDAAVMSYQLGRRIRECEL
jgi:hypothetical protein